MLFLTPRSARVVPRPTFVHILSFKKHPRPGRKHDLGRIVFDTAHSEFGASAAVMLSTPKNPRRTVRNSVQAGDWVDYA